MRGHKVVIICSMSELVFCLGKQLFQMGFFFLNKLVILYKNAQLVICFPLKP